MSSYICKLFYLSGLRLICYKISVHNCYPLGKFTPPLIQKKAAANYSSHLCYVPATQQEAVKISINDTSAETSNILKDPSKVDSLTGVFDCEKSKVDSIKSGFSPHR